MSETGNCCIATALEDPEATFCMTCGKPLLRCMAFQECGGIVNSSGLCPVCVKPQLHIIPGASMNASIGGAVTVPFELVNASRIDRPLFVKQLMSRERGEWRDERLGWERLGSAQRGAASVTARELDAAGLHEINIMFTVATQWRSREERFAFSAQVLLTIAEDKDRAASSIQISSEDKMMGNVIQVQLPESEAGQTGRVIEAFSLKLTRQDREERELGLRGLDASTRMQRSANFVFKGFGKGQVPARDGPIVTPDAMLVFGRAYTRASGGEVDARLLLQDSAGALDEDRSVRISRRHFEIYVENERPMLHVASANGVRINGKAYGIDKVVPLQDGDVIAPLVKDPDALALSLRFRRELDRVSAVEITRSPAWREDTP